MSNDTFMDEIEFNSPSEEIDLPDDPGPALAGKTPVIGTLRRNNDMTVLRDELKDQL
jgi:hypothetical protein